MDLQALLKSSRPRFWLYLAGPYALGYAAGVTDIYALGNWHFLIHLIYFLVPANILLYGINDLFDRETDRTNRKKDKKEHRLKPTETRNLIRIVLVVGILSFILLSASKSLTEFLLWLFFLGLSVFYSTPPLRFKARPVLDFVSNILYIVPGILAYTQVTGKIAPAEIWIAGAAWTGAMHLYSAIPDIESDKKAKISTTATRLGHSLSLLLCVLLWTVSLLIALTKQELWPWSLMGILYPLIPLVLIFQKKEMVEKVYWYFPLLNGIMGFVLFWLLVGQSVAAY